MRFPMKLAFPIQVCTGEFTAIFSSNASNDVVLQLLFEANRIARLTR